MTIADVKDTSRPDPARYLAAMGYEAPFLIDKLIEERIVERREDGEALFMEVKRYLVIDRTYPDKRFEMYSRRVDEVWHQFILFTTQYQSFCRNHFGEHLHHFPGNAPDSPIVKSPTPSERINRLAEFATTYEAMFGGALSEIWFDHKSVTIDRRVILHHEADALTVAPDGDLISLTRPDGVKLLGVSPIARLALEFIVRTRAFYVRELPGGLVDEEKVALVDTLVAKHILRLAS